MKESIQVYKRDFYQSDSAGGVVRYHPDATTFETLGQAKYLFLHLRIYSVSGGTTPTMKVKFYHSAIEGTMPSVSGINIGGWDFTKNAPGTFMEVKSGGHAGFLEVVVEVVDGSTAGMVKVEMEMYATAVVEE